MTAKDREEFMEAARSQGLKGEQLEEVLRIAELTEETAKSHSIMFSGNVAAVLEARMPAHVRANVLFEVIYHSVWGILTNGYREGYRAGWDAREALK